MVILSTMHELQVVYLQMIYITWRVFTTGRLLAYLCYWMSADIASINQKKLCSRIRE